jgi:hypothetical protein
MHKTFIYAQSMTANSITLGRFVDADTDYSTRAVGGFDNCTQQWSWRSGVRHRTRTPCEYVQGESFELC